jgi:hypothetical protein
MVPRVSFPNNTHCDRNKPTMTAEKSLHRNIEVAQYQPNTLAPIELHR